MVVMMDMEISCKGHCEKLSHFLEHVSHTVVSKYNVRLKTLLLQGFSEPEFYGDLV